MRIYIDTSIINGLYSNDERIQSITKDFFHSAKFGHFTLYGSETVSIEIKNTPDIEKRRLLIDIIEVNRINQKHNLPQIDLCSPEEV